jgi:hypothetical protein
VVFTAPQGINPNPPSTVSASPTSVPADGVSFSTVTAHLTTNDASLAAGSTVSLFVNAGASNVTVQSSTDGTTFINSSSTTANANGDAFFRVRSTTGNQNVTITIQASNAATPAGIELTQHPVITFTAIATPVTPTSTGNPATLLVSVTPGGPTVTPPPGATVVGGTVDQGQSLFFTDCSSIPADNINVANLTVVLKNSTSGPVPGKAVSIVGNPVVQNSQITTIVGTTDANGTAKFQVRSPSAGGPVTYTATDVTDNIVLTKVVQVTFVQPGPGVACVVATAIAGQNGTPGVASTATASPLGVAALTAAANGPNIGVVIPYRLCVRMAPGTFYPALGTLRQKTVVVLLGRNRFGTARNFPPRPDCQRGNGGATWFLIQLDGDRVGWVSAFYIRVRRLQFRHLPTIDLSPANTYNLVAVDPTVIR